MHTFFVSSPLASFVVITVAVVVLKIQYSSSQEEVVQVEEIEEINSSREAEDRERLHRVIVDYRLSNLKSHLLFELGMTSPPPKDIVKSVPKHLRRHIVQHAHLDNEAEDSRNSKTIPSQVEEENVTAPISLIDGTVRMDVGKRNRTNFYKTTLLHQARHFQKLLYASIRKSIYSLLKNALQNFNIF